jgi:L-alanine-DL-glutamate epimerase-like enolase superfamily enzyme
MNHPRAIRIVDVSHSYEDFRYRTPIKFGGVALDRVTILNVTMTIEHADGRRGAAGFGSMPLGNVWSFPSRVLTYDDTLGVMKRIADAIPPRLMERKEAGHPIEISMAAEHALIELGSRIGTAMNLAEKVPPLCTMVVASAFDAALHDAYGKSHGRSAYHTLGREYLPRDLGTFLGAEFADEWLDQYIAPDPVPTLPLYHLIGALDPLEERDIKKPVGDGLPETLPQWIERDGLTHLKIKLNGDDLSWDVDRVVRVDRLSEATQARRRVTEWHYSLDFNERCENVGYLLEFLHRVKEQTPRGFDRIAYIEQPTARDLAANRHNVMHEASKLKPVVIDESLLNLETLQLAREMGYTGAALKACKGQSQSLLLAAAARKYGMFLCVQDLTCAGASLIHSAGLAAHVPGVSAIESNARQYIPDANAPWAARFPGIFTITDGQMRTGEITGPGLGAVP